MLWPHNECMFVVLLCVPEVIGVAPMVLRGFGIPFRC